MNVRDRPCLIPCHGWTLSNGTRQVWTLHLPEFTPSGPIVHLGSATPPQRVRPRGPLAEICLRKYKTKIQACAILYLKSGKYIKGLKEALFWNTHGVVVIVSPKFHVFNGVRYWWCICGDNLLSHVVPPDCGIHIQWNLSLRPPEKYRDNLGIRHLLKSLHLFST